MMKQKNPVSSKLVNFDFDPGFLFPNGQPYNKIGLDSNGHFDQSMYSRIYTIYMYPLNESPASTFYDTVINIEPDFSANFVIHLNRIIDKVHNLITRQNITISNYPNPFTENTYINIQIPNSNNIKNGIVKFYNNEGEIIKIIPLGNYYKNLKSYSIKLDDSMISSLKPGIYYYTLESNGINVASNKMTFIR